MKQNLLARSDTFEILKPLCQFKELGILIDILDIALLASESLDNHIDRLVGSNNGGVIVLRFDRVWEGLDCVHDGGSGVLSNLSIEHVDGARLAQELNGSRCLYGQGDGDGDLDRHLGRITVSLCCR